MKILIADSFPPAHRDALAAGGDAVAFEPNLDGDALAGALGENEILIVRSTKINAAMIDAAPRLKLIIRAGAGTNTIDKAHARARGVRVCNVPGANSAAVAELVLGLIIALDRRIADNVADLRAGRWRKKEYAKAQGLHGRAIGILGLGAIGAAVAQRAHAFGMRVGVVAKPVRSARTQRTIEAFDIAEADSTEALVARSDVITLHLPLTADNAGLVDDDFLANMRDGAILINTSRGELVDEAALIRAMDARGIRAGLDVYRNEPASGEGAFESALANHPCVYGTHHIGASTAQAQNAVADGALRVIESYKQGDLLHCVNES
ncbi:MAG: NAD(P)-dependent oxidoreductase [bacterium]